MEDETIKVLIGGIKSDIKNLKKDIDTVAETVRDLSDSMSKMDKHNAEEHAAIKANIDNLNTKMAASPKVLAAIISVVTGMMGLIGYLVHVIK